jgi:hypothetical protein
MDRDIFKYLTDLRSFGARSGLMAAGLAANAEIFQFRNPDTNTGKMVVLDCRLMAAVGGTAFTPGAVVMRFSKAAAWTVDGTGGTAQTLTTTAGMINSSYGASQLPTMRIASTAALTAGTKTLGEDFASSTSGSSAGLGDTILNFDAFSYFRTGYPLTFNPGEGFAIRATVPATGIWQFNTNMVWGFTP